MLSYRDHNKGAMLLFLKDYPVIDLIATGDNIKRLRVERGLTVRDLQKYFGFEEPQAIYKWQRGQSLPTVDNLYALGNLFGITMDEILVPVRNQLYIDGEQQGEPCCSHLFSGALQRDPLRGRCHHAPEPVFVDRGEIPFRVEPGGFRQRPDRDRRREKVLAEPRIHALAVHAGHHVAVEPEVDLIPF